MSDSTREAEAILSAFGEVLGTRPDSDAIIADLGLDSLGAIRLLGKLRERAIPTLTFAQLFESGLRVADLARLVEPQPVKVADGPATVSGSVRVGLRVADPNSAGRSALSPVNAVFHLRGPLDIEAMRMAVCLLSVRHQALRCCLSEDGSEPRLVEVPDARVATAVRWAKGTTIAERRAWAAGWISREVTVSLTLSVAPLMRSTLIRIDPDEHYLVLVADHIVTDGWSFQVLARDLGAAYANPASIRVAEPGFTVWLERETERLGGARGGELIRFWRGLLGPDPDVIRWRFPDFGLATPGDYTGAAVAGVLDRAATARLHELAARMDATVFATMAVVLLRVLWPLAEGDCRCLMTTVANRIDPGSADLVGNCVNTVWIPAELDFDEQLASAVARFQDTVRSMLAHQDAPDRWLLRELYPGVYKGFPDVPQVYFLHAAAWEEDLFLSGVAVEGREWAEGTAQPGLQVYATEREDGMTVSVHWRPGEFTEDTVAAVLESYVDALNTAARSA